MAKLDDLLEDLVTANHVLAKLGIVDSFGHISIRHPDRPDRFFLSCSRAPERVKRDDILEFNLECEVIDSKGKQLYTERPIHGGAYQARPDVKLLPLYTTEEGGHVFISSDTWPGTGGVLGLTKAQVAEAIDSGMP